MSKFQSTISVVAALASIFGAGAAGWKLAQSEQAPVEVNAADDYEERIRSLQEEVTGLKQQQPDVVESAPQEAPNEPKVVAAPHVPAQLPQYPPAPAAPEEPTR